LLRSALILPVDLITRARPSSSGGMTLTPGGQGRGGACRSGAGRVLEVLKKVRW
jgi:hypothetical protein